MRCSSGGRGVRGEVLVDGPARALPVAVVVDDQHAALAPGAGRGARARAASTRTSRCRGAAARAGPGACAGQRLLDRAADEVHALGRVAGAPAARSRTASSLNISGSNSSDQARSPLLPASRQVSSAGGSSARDVVLGGLGHALERVVEVDVAVVDAELLQRQDHRQHRTAAPHAALREARPGARAATQWRTASISACRRIAPVIVYARSLARITWSAGLVSAGSGRSRPPAVRVGGDRARGGGGPWPPATLSQRAARRRTAQIGAELGQQPALAQQRDGQRQGGEQRQLGSACSSVRSPPQSASRAAPVTATATHAGNRPRASSPGSAQREQAAQVHQADRHQHRNPETPCPRRSLKALGRAAAAPPRPPLPP